VGRCGNKRKRKRREKERRWAAGEDGPGWAAEEFGPREKEKRKEGEKRGFDLYFFLFLFQPF
jgi:hypothetical protein